MSSQQEEREQQLQDERIPPPTKKLKTADALSKGDSTNKFKRELSKLPFHIFEYISDVGYFRWIPRPTSAGTIEDVQSTEEICDQIDINGKPHKMIVPLSEMNRNLPKAFLRDLSKQEYPNVYPYGQTDVAFLHVASQHRGIDLEGVDFCLGGSALGMLANRDISVDHSFFVTSIPGLKRTTLLLTNRKQYTRDRSFFSFQFERFVTGRDMADSSPIEFFEHMQLMKLGGKYTVLFRAECDAILNSSGEDQDGDGDHDEPVEVKANNPVYWDNRLIFQMISNGSPTFCHGIKHYGILEQVQLKSLSSLVAELLMRKPVRPAPDVGAAATAIASNHNYKDNISEIRRLEKNILEGLDDLKLEMMLLKKEEERGHNYDDDEGQLLLQLGFTTEGKIRLSIPSPAVRSSSALLPPGETVKRLI